MEADPGGTHEVATPHSAAAAVLVPATDEVAAQESEEPEDLWGDREVGHGAEASAVQADPGAGGEAAEHEAAGAVAAAEEGSEPADAEAEAAAEEAAAEVPVALGGGCSSEDEDEDEEEVSDDDEPCTAEQRDVAKKAKGKAKEAPATKPLQVRGGAKAGAKLAHARSSAKVIKRANTGFQLFSFEKRAEVAEQLPGGDGKEVMKLLSETWKELRASERVGYNERAAGVPAVGTALLVRPVISAAAQGELSGWHAGEVHAMLQGARFLVEVRHPAPPRPLGACQAPCRIALPPRRTALPLHVPRRAEHRWRARRRCSRCASRSAARPGARRRTATATSAGATRKTSRAAA